MINNLKIKILFLGASKRVSLIEYFLKSANELNVGLELYSCEHESKFYPISQYASIIPGPDFKQPEFGFWLNDFLKAKGIDIVIPNMDAATVALSYFKETKKEFEASWMVVSNYELCIKMEDKILSDEFFKSKNIPVPLNSTDIFPKYIKNRFGFGGRDTYIVKNQKDLNRFFQNVSTDKYIIQDEVKGQESTVDIYFSRQGVLIGYIIRDRYEVSDGEVMSCSTREPYEIEKELINKVCAIPGWQGCITLQYIRDGNNITVIEINPRFGGGVTCSIEAGLDMPLYLLSEYIKIPYKLPDHFKKIYMTRARKDYFYEYN
ncbi:MAG: ATP-grasp domain-containing protein [Chitinophagaceae bacterium]|nr:MAG: ATP-grasp domain-containing protein [Chitinophagaceae bacterium]